MKFPRMVPAGLAFVFLLGPAPASAENFASLVGFARIPSNARDSLGETLGGFGSGMALVPGSWKQKAHTYTARLAMLPDRGWNTDGTTDYKARLQYFDVRLSPQTGAKTGAKDARTGFQMTYRRSLLLTGKDGGPTTGFDASGVRPAGGGHPDLPIAANGAIAMDSEAVAMVRSGGFWVSDEYGPYVYRFDAKGKMTGAIRPPDAFIPMREGRENFSANSPPRGEKYDKGNPQSGRQNNQGFEGMSLTPDGRHMLVVNQSALIQDLDPKAVKTSRRHVRVLDYDLAGTLPRLVHEYVVALPLYNRDKSDGLVAAQSEMLALNDHQMLLLCRDSGGGQSLPRDASVFRSILVVDLSGATDVAGKYDGVGESVAPLGVLRPDIAAAKTDVLLDMNDNGQLNRFGLHNGAPNDANDLYEKWESMALAPAGDTKAPDDYFLFVGSDNDFITQDGMMAGKHYADASGANVDSLVLVYRVSLPGIHMNR